MSLRNVFIEGLFFVKTTIVDIARECGVAKSTVSRILSGTGPAHNAEMVVKVRETAKKLGYRPNMGARTFVKGSSSLIGMVGVSQTIRFFANVRRGLEICIDKNGYLPVSLCPLPDRRESTASIVQKLLNYRAEGVIIIPGEKDTINDYIEFKHYDIPVVLVNLPITGWENCNFVGTNDYEGGKIAAVRFFERGHRKVVIAMSSMTRLPDFEQRRNGFSETFESLGGSVTASYEVAENLLSGLDGATAVFAVSDQIAKLLLIAAWKCGMRIPDDFSLIGFGDKDECLGATPPLTMIHQDGFKIGTAAAELLLENIKSRKNNEGTKQIRLIPTLSIGSSDRQI